MQDVMDIIDGVRQDLRDQSDPIKAEFFPHYFKVEEGDKDEFLGVTVPKQRVIAKKYYKQILPKDVVDLLHSEVHEERLTALMIWVLQFQKGTEAIKKSVYGLYLANTDWVNNWDLVDLSAREIVGSYIFDKDQSILTKLSKSTNVWERRIAMVATYYFIQRGQFYWTLQLAEQYLGDSHHYIHKASGWMLREVGKKDEAVLRDFLDKNASQMPRTMLRYSIERLPEVQRKAYLHKK